MKPTTAIEVLASRWLAQIEARNNAGYGSTGYRKAEAAAEHYERQASLFTFGDISHSMTECLEHFGLSL